MLMKHSKFYIRDSSSILLLKVFHLYPRATSIVTPALVFGVVRRELYNKRTFKKRKLYALVMILNKKVFRQAGGYFYRFDHNMGMMLTEDKTQFLAVKLFCPLTQEVLRSSYGEICQYSRRIF